MKWSTEIINFLQNNNLTSNLLSHSPFFHNNENIRKPNLIFEFTPEEITSLCLIQNDLKIFSSYLKLKDNPITLYKFQQNLLDNFNSEKFNLILNSRQVGITLLYSIFCLHYLVTQQGKSIVIFCNKLDSGVELIKRIKDLYHSLPFYMKPGVLAWNAASLKFDNGNQINIIANRNPVIGRNIDCLIIQDAAFIPSLQESYKSIFPIQSALKNSKMIINSTPSGYNFFYTLINNTKNGLTNFKLTEIDWKQFGNRDEDWKTEMIKNLGSKELFEQEYELKFIDSNKIISNEEIKSKLLSELKELIKELSLNLNPKALRKLGKIQKQLKKLQS